MRFKNNSNHEWLGYNCGHCLVDIPANSEFGCDEKAGFIILRNLGCPQWVVRIEESPEEEVKNVFCEFCNSKGVKHKKDCTRPK